MGLVIVLRSYYSSSQGERSFCLCQGMRVSRVLRWAACDGPECARARPKSGLPPIDREGKSNLLIFVTVTSPDRRARTGMVESSFIIDWLAVISSRHRTGRGCVRKK